MKCDICKCEETFVKKHHHVYDVRGKGIVFDLDRRFCKNCNSLVYDHKLDNEASKMAIYLYTKECGIEKEKYNKSSFTQEELKIINLVKKKFENYTPEQIVNFSHQEKAFSKTQIYHPISYEYALDLNID